jgi:hypothetical protein
MNSSKQNNQRGNIMLSKKELIQQIAKQLQSYGYTVYVSKSGEYGFYTDGKKCVDFGSHWSWCVDFGGNYKSQSCGTGWGIDGGKQLTQISEEQAKRFIDAMPPRWATNGEQVTLTTPEQYLKNYSISSGYEEFKPNND